ncbi:thermonuclease family protein [Paludibaculum fermentans]|uniref:Thermonuclease family protein n=1 Tax=Paludibaculum fermentans TaxID=1473598 RepID=A0A7S7SL09_PALFE|nr:thermonuclease family protein [Paludibaculum fermentans]QOY89737.1 thermonuclease family protein [Paludibaculum fermentans]
MLRRLAPVLLAVIALANGETWTGKVVGIQDGDTITILRVGRPVRVRLDGVDCPELGQAFGGKARERVSVLVFGSVVVVRESNVASGRDRYGRVVGQVILPDGRNLNRVLVAEGLAWWYRRYAPRDAVLADLEERARESGLGLWADADPEPPWLWRAQKRKRLVGEAAGRLE